ncbi:MAG: DUF3833 domain-containing protein [Gammaproteobacteria bacterium]
MTITRLLFPLLAAFAAAGCSSMDIRNFEGSQPEFRIEDYFDGQSRAWGMFQDRSGKIRAQFTVDLNGQWEGDEFVLREDFHYRDGRREQRIWRIRKVDAHRYEGRAGDVVGVAEGRAWGQALNWRYTLRLTVGKRQWDMHLDDWMFLQPDGVLINRAVMRKFGFKVGEITIVFQRGASALN